MDFFHRKKRDLPFSQLESDEMPVAVEDLVVARVEGRVVV